jgi:hypothetical protein
MRNTQPTREGTEAALPRRGYSIPVFCETYDVCRSKAYEEIAAGRLKARKAGRRTIIAAEDAEDWFSQLPYVRPA